MRRSRVPFRAFLSALLLLSAASALPAQVPPAGTTSRVQLGRSPHTAADVEFMQGMIGHHAQALVMAKWAATHGARPDVLTLCARIILGQSTEIALMQAWLRDRKEVVPDSTGKMPGNSMAGMAGMAGMDHTSHDAMMPGMLTAEQMALLEKSRGADFDRLFLTFMIQHHRGALVMVAKLFDTPGAALDDDAFKLASGAQADQTAEIARMELMLLGPPKNGGRF